MTDETQMFRALNSPIRRQIIACLYNGSTMSAVDFAEGYEISITAIRRHLQVLEDANLIRRNKVGRRNECRINKDALDKLNYWESELAISWLDMLILEGK